MAHKKGQGSSRNGRDSNSQRRGVKVYGGQNIQCGIHYRAAGRNKNSSGQQCRPGQGFYAFRAHQRRREI